ncbi:MAG: hypothetical protein ABGY71_14485 [bacterium]|jgi:hypothetical protein|nr:hypothetical protein [Planctomycetota bacterium]HIL51139.1 hypothetical protein [Planctomycetota bacterium]
MSADKQNPDPKLSKASKKTAKPKQKGPRALKPLKPDEMTAEVMDFLSAIDEYKRVNERPFPSWSEVLVILKDLGYKRSA